MDSLLEIAISNTIIATMLAVFVACVGIVCRKPAVIHCLWLVVLLRFLMPPLIPVSLDLPMMISMNHDAVETESASASAPNATYSSTRERNAESKASAPSAEGVANSLARNTDGVHPRIGNDSSKADTSSLVVSHELNVVSDSVVESTIPGTPSFFGRFWQPISAAARQLDWPLIRAIGFNVWVGGSIAIAFVLGFRVIRFRRFLAKSVPAPDGMQNETEELARRIGLRRCPTVWLVPGRVSPMLWAFGGSARVVFPIELLSRLDSKSRRTLIMHELSHFRRGDHWIRLIEVVATLFYWWNPILWWTRRRLRIVEEQCCDNEVIAEFGDDRESYATALMQTIDFLSASDRVPVPSLASGLGQFKQTKRRLTMIMTETSTRRIGRLGKIGVATIALAMLPWMPTIGQEATDKKPRPASVEPASDNSTTTVDLSAPPTRVASKPRGVEQTKSKENNSAATESPLPKESTTKKQETKSQLPAIKIHLIANADGSLAKLMLGQVNLGGNQKAFERLTDELVKIIGELDASQVKDIEVEITADPSLHYEHLVAAISACTGREDSKIGKTVLLIRKIKFIQQRQDVEGKTTPLQQNVRNAVERASKYLVSQQQPDGSWKSLGGGHQTGLTALCTLALLKSGTDPKSAAIRKAFEFLRRSEPTKTYDVALQTLALCAAFDERDLARIKRNVDWLQRAQIKTGRNVGGWSYTEGLTGSCDYSNAEFAVWALDEAAQVGVKTDKVTWQRALKNWANGQNADGSWGYIPTNSVGTGGMTCAGITSVLICESHLADDKTKDNVDRKPSEAVTKGLSSLEKHFTVKRNPVRVRRPGITST